MKKRIIYLLILLCLSCMFIGCGEEEQEDIMQIRGYTEGTQSEYVFTDGNLELHFDETTTQFYVVEKTTGEVWYSNPQDIANDAMAESATKKILNSTIYLEYSNREGENQFLYNYASSIEKQLYEVEILDNGVKVLYTIGNIDRVYYIPKAVPESRYHEFYDAMDKEGQRLCDNQYKKYDINNLSITDASKKSELIETYPGIEYEPVFVFINTSNKQLMEKIEGKFESVGYDAEQYQIDIERYSVTNDSDKPIYNVSMYIQLIDGELAISIPLDEIEYKEDYPLVRLTCLPYFGATGTDENGFIFVPDGSGAIINFNNGKYKQTQYYNTVYGWDYAQYRSNMLTGSNSVQFPVFGMSKAMTSFICIIEEGDAYAVISADVAGRYHSYNYVNCTYNINYYQDLDVSSKSNKTVRLFQKYMPEGELRQVYRFNNKTSYASMAIDYRDYLIDQYPELEKKTEAKVPTVIEIVGAIDRVEQVCGFPSTIDYPLTTYSEALEIVNELSDLGIEDFTVKYDGWANRGVMNKAYSNIKLISELGSKKDFNQFTQYLSNNNIELYLESDFEFVYRNSLFDSFIPIRDSAKFIGRELTELYPFWPVWFGEKGSDYMYYLAKPSYIISRIKQYKEDIEELGVSNISFGDIGKYLAGDYNVKSFTTRDDAIDMQTELFKELKTENTGIMVYSGNQYCIPYTDYILDMKLESLEFNILDYDVPFYQIALHGLVDYCGEAINLAADYEENMLKTMETGAGLYYIIMNASASELQETEYTQYYASEFSLWKDDITDKWSEMNEDLKNIYNQYIINHQQLSDKITMTEYEDGTKVIVNYSYDDYVYNGVIVNKRDYYIERGN